MVMLRVRDIPLPLSLHLTTVTTCCSYKTLTFLSFPMLSHSYDPFLLPITPLSAKPYNLKAHRQHSSFKQLQGGGATEFKS